MESSRQIQLAWNKGNQMAVWGKEPGSLSYEEGELLNGTSLKYGYLGSFLYLSTALRIFSSVFACASWGRHWYLETN